MVNDPHSSGSSKGSGLRRSPPPSSTSKGKHPQVAQPESAASDNHEEDDDNAVQLQEAREQLDAAQKQLAAQAAQLAEFAARFQRLESQPAHSNSSPAPFPASALEQNGTNITRQQSVRFDSVLPSIEPARDSRQPSLASSGASLRREKIPLLPCKLSDGKAYKAKLWNRQILDRLEWYQDHFFNENHRRSFILDNTEGIARDFLEPLFLDLENTQDALELVDAVTTFLSDPAEQDIAMNEFLNLNMDRSPSLSFWDFYQRFRTLATTAQIRDDLSLRTALRDKITPALRRGAVLEWNRCRTIDQYASVIQQLDADDLAVRTRNSRRTNASYKPTSQARGNAYKEVRQSDQSSIPSSGPPHTGQPTSAPAGAPKHYSSSPATRQPSAGSQNIHRDRTSTPHQTRFEQRRSHSIHVVDAEQDSDSGEDHFEEAREEQQHHLDPAQPRSKDDA